MIGCLKENSNKKVHNQRIMTIDFVGWMFANILQLNEPNAWFGIRNVAEKTSHSSKNNINQNAESSSSSAQFNRNKKIA